MKKAVDAWASSLAFARDAYNRHRRKAILLLPLILVAAGFYLCLSDPLFRAPFSTVLLARDGRLLGARIADDGQWRFPEAPCPARFATATMAYEDGRFLRHPGVDPLALLRAAVQNVRAGKVVSGASTLTMQVVRLSRRGLAARGRPRTFCEKAVEAALALRLELAFGKDEVLSLYSAHAPFGGNVVGLSAASWRYFGRAPGELSWAEAALLAVLPNSPALMHPGRNREPLRRKRDRLLTRLWRQGRLDSLTCALAVLEPLPATPVPFPREAPHALRRLASGAPAVYPSTLDADLQSQLNGILDRHRRHLEGAGIGNAAVLVLHTPTGEARAYVGNLSGTPDPADGRDVDIVSSPRSTGSLLKPLLYAAMLEAGEILPSTLVPDIPTLFNGFAAENFDRGYEGAVPARMALARSLNVPAVRMLKDYGIERFLHLLRALGLSTLTRSAGDYGLTLVLGGAEGTLWELAGLYAGLARESLRYAEPVASDTPSAFRPAFFPPRLVADAPLGGKSTGSSTGIGPAAAWLTLQAMAEVSRPDGEQYWRQFASSRWVAWKTGTSFGFRDAWAVGVTPEFTVGVWLGNASGQGRPGMTGIQVAAPVLFETFNLLPPTSEFPRPMASLRRIPVCGQSGMRPSPYCPAVDSAWVPVAGLRTAACPHHRMVHLDSTGGFQVHDGCRGVAVMRHEAWFVLPPSQEWYYRRRHSDYLPLPPWHRDCADGVLALGGVQAMDLLYPRGAARIYVPVELDARKGRTVFEAVHRDPKATVFWHLDQGYLGQTREFHRLALDPAPGKHILLLVDDRGERLERGFEVLAKGDAR